MIESDFSYAIGRPFQHIEHELSKVKAYVETGHIGMLHLTYSRQYNLREEYDQDGPRNDSLAALNRPELKYQIVTHAAEMRWEHEKWNGIKGEIGVSGITQANSTGGFFFIPNFRNRTMGAFLIERLVKLRWELEAGIRYDHKWQRIWMYENDSLISPSATWSNVSGSLGGLVRANEHWNLRANLGTAWRPPAINELFADGLHHGAAAIEIGDRDLQPEQAWNATISAQYKGHDELTAEISAYYNYIQDFIYLQPVLPPTLTIRGAFPTFYYQQADARFAGVDLSANWMPLQGLRLDGKASILRARNISP